MNKKKILLKGYFTIFLFVLSFFTVYAFRHDALNYLYEDNPEKFILQDKDKEIIKSKLLMLDASLENINEVSNIVKPYLHDFYFSINTTSKMNNEYEQGEGMALFYYASYGQSPSKYAYKYEDVIDVNFKDTTGGVITYPTYTSFYREYSIFSLCVSTMICFLFLFIWHKEEKHFFFRNLFLKAFHKLPKKIFHKLSMQLFMVNLMAAILALSCFFYMYHNRYAFFDFVRDFQSPPSMNEFASYVDGVQSEIKDIALNKKNKKKVSELIERDLPQLATANLYDESDIYYIGSRLPQSIERVFYRNDFYDVSSVYTASFYNYRLGVKDQNAMITIYYYPLIELVEPYQYTTILLALSLYLLFLFLFINKKVKHIKVMQEDIAVLASGDWMHGVHEIGEDEIGELGAHLNQMRTSFIANVEKERQAVHANKELITSLSHDIRTPLTSLLGYLDIISLKKYKDEEQYQQYLQNCIEKVHQINALSNKTFEYALVFEVEDEFEKELLDVHEIVEYVQSNIEYLHLQAFKVKSEVCVQATKINGNMIMLQRIINNLFSNVLKYADKQKDTIISLTQDKDNLKLMFANEKSENAELIESNQIGLKSVKRMVELHKGEMFVNNQEDSFIVVICLPLLK